MEADAIESAAAPPLAAPAADSSRSLAVREHVWPRAMASVRAAVAELGPVARTRRAVGGGRSESERRRMLAGRR